MSMPRKIRCTVAAVIPHGDRVYTIDLKPETPVPAFRPGHFMHLTVDDYDPAGFWPESRVFSIASSPRDRQRIRFCYAVKGRYTARLEQALHPGVEVWIKLPYGEFVIDDTQDVVLIAGGTGISAFTAFIEALLPDTPRKVWLVYGARTPDLWLFREMIEQQLARCPSFSAVFFAETGLSADLHGTPEARIGAEADHGTPEARIRAEADHGTPEARIRAEAADLCPPSSVPRILPGRICLDPLFPPSTIHHPPSSDPRSPTSDLRPPASDLRPPTSDLPASPRLCRASCLLTSPVFYLSGPPPMLASLRTDLQGRGVAADRIRTDAWD
jgi:ferredoxin-NADP reductase